jgi:Ser-tRNA(Ala) deacylase AlaX
MTTVTIGDREFRIGATYQGKIDPKYRMVIPRQRALLRVIGGEVWFRTKTGDEQSAPSGNWLRWAGDEVTP